MIRTVVNIVGLGAIAGMRTMSAPAFLASYLAAREPEQLKQSPFRWFGSTTVATMLKCMAITEFIADKLPFIPARIEPAPLAGRAVSGAFVGTIVSAIRGKSALLGAVLGGSAAIAAAFAAYHARRQLTVMGLPDPVVALGEDVIVLAGGKAMSDNL